MKRGKKFVVLPEEEYTHGVNMPKPASDFYNPQIEPNVILTAGNEAQYRESKDVAKRIKERAEQESLLKSIGIDDERAMFLYNQLLQSRLRSSQLDAATRQLQEQQQERDLLLQQLLAHLQNQTSLGSANLSSNNSTLSRSSIGAYATPSVTPGSDGGEEIWGTGGPSLKPVVMAEKSTMSMLPPQPTSTGEATPHRSRSHSNLQKQSSVFRDLLSGERSGREASFSPKRSTSSKDYIQKVINEDFFVDDHGVLRQRETNYSYGKVKLWDTLDWLTSSASRAKKGKKAPAGAHHIVDILVSRQLDKQLIKNPVAREYFERRERALERSSRGKQHRPTVRRQQSSQPYVWETPF